MPNLERRSSFPPKNIPLVFLVAVSAVFLGIIGSYGFVGPDEPRYARIAQEMLGRGDWVVPTLKGVPWLEKPPLLYWAQMGAYCLFGVNEFAARFPTILAAIILVAVVFATLKGVYGRRMAFFAALILGSTLEYVAFAGANNPDMLFTCTMGCGLLLLWRSLDTEGWTVNVLMGAAFALFGLACLAKGPLTLVIVILALIPFAYVAGKLDWLIHWRIIPPLFIFMVVSLPWFVLIYLREKFHFILIFFINHNLARFFTTLHHHTQPFYYFLLVLLIGFMPWTGLLFYRWPLPALIREAWRDLPSGGVVFMLSWVVFPLLFFSLSSSKLGGYILPLFPALAALAAWRLEAFFDCGRPIPRVVWIGFSFLAVMLLAAVPLFLQSQFRLGWRGVALSALALPGLALFIWFYRSDRRETAMACFALTLLLPVAVGVPLVKDEVEPFFNQRQLCLLAKPYTGLNNPLIIFRAQHHSNDYYTDYTCTEPLFKVEELRPYLEAGKFPRYLISDEEGKRQLENLPHWRSSALRKSGQAYLLKLEYQSVEVSR